MKSPLTGMVNHFLKCNLEQILSRSLLHCHSPNLHSIVFRDSPQMIRLFIAQPNHKLFLNHPNLFKDYYNQSVGFHAHHCELTLVPTRGKLSNWIIKPSVVGKLLLKEYEYRSAITQGQIGFTYVGEKLFNSKEFKHIPVGESKYMPATDIHTVFVTKGEWASWFVLEGKENLNYDNKCLSTTDVEKEDFSRLYKPVKKNMLLKLLKEAHLV